MQLIIFLLSLAFLLGNERKTKDGKTYNPILYVLVLVFLAFVVCFADGMSN